MSIDAFSPLEDVQEAIANLSAFGDGDEPLNISIRTSEGGTYSLANAMDYLAAAERKLEAAATRDPDGTVMAALNAVARDIPGLTLSEFVRITRNLMAAGRAGRP